MRKRLAFTILIVLLTLIISSLVATAYTIPDEYKPVNAPLDSYIDNSDAGNTTILILQIIAGGLLYFAAPVAIIMIIQGGFTLITGGGDSEKLDTAKKHLTWAGLGLVLIILSYSIVRALIDFVIRASTIAN